MLLHTKHSASCDIDSEWNIRAAEIRSKPQGYIAELEAEFGPREPGT